MCFLDFYVCFAIPLTLIINGNFIEFLLRRRRVAFKGFGFTQSKCNKLYKLLYDYTNEINILALSKIPICSKVKHAKILIFTKFMSNIH